MKSYLPKKPELRTKMSGLVLITTVLILSSMASAQVEFRDSNGFDFYNDLGIYSDLSIEDGNISMNNNRILGLPEPTSSGEPLTQGSGSGDYVDRTGDSMTGDLDIQDNWLLGDSGELNLKGGGVTVNGSNQILELNQNMPATGNPATLLFRENGASNWGFISMQDGGLGIYDFEADEIVQEFNENGEVIYDGRTLDIKDGYINLTDSGLTGTLSKKVENEVNPEWIFENNGGIAELYVDSSDNVYIGGGQQNRTITKLSNSGSHEWSFSDFSWDAGAIASGSDNVYISSGTCCQPQGEFIYKLDKSNGDLLQIKKEMDDIYDLAMDGSGNLVTAGRNPDISKRDTSDLNSSWEYDSFGDRRATSIDFDSSGNIYAGGYDILEKLDSSGNRLWRVDGGFSWVADLEVNGSDIYLIERPDTEDKQRHLVNYDTDGNKEWNISLDGAGSSVDVGENGNLWTSGSNSIKKLDGSGNMIHSSENPHFGSIIQFDSNGEFFVKGNEKVVKLSEGSDTDEFIYAKDNKMVIGSNYEPELGSEMLRIDGDLKVNGNVEASRTEADIYVDDTRGEAKEPLERSNEVDFDFKRSSTMKPPSGNNFGGLMTFAIWGDSTGDEFHQLFMNEKGPFYRPSDNSKTTWRPWQKILTSGDDLTVGLKDSNKPIHIRDWEGYSGISYDISGPNKLTLGGDYTGTTERDYRIRVSTDGSPDQFEWSDDGGSTWNGELSMSRSFQELSNGVEVRWRADRGDTIENYAVGDQWNFTAYANNGDVIEGDGSNLDLESDKTSVSGDLEAEQDLEKVDPDTGQEFSVSAKDMVAYEKITPARLETYGDIEIGSSSYSIPDNRQLRIEAGGADDIVARSQIVPLGTLSSNKRYIVRIKASSYYESYSSDNEWGIGVDDDNNWIGNEVMDNGNGGNILASDNQRAINASRADRSDIDGSYFRPPGNFVMDIFLEPDSSDHIVFQSQGHEQTYTVQYDLDPSNGLYWTMWEIDSPDTIFEESTVEVYEVSKNEEALIK